MPDAEIYLELQNELSRKIEGEIYFDKITRVLYSTDASNYQIEPVGVVVPKNHDDVAYTIECARKHNVSILPRGGGTSLAGQSIGHSLIIDFSKYLNRVIDFDRDSKTVTVEPGLYLGALNTYLGKYNMMFGPDPASARVATIGGVIGNNSTGSHSILYGMAGDNISHANVYLSDGSELELSPDSDTEFHSRLLDFKHRNETVVSESFPKHWRRASGYSLNYLLESKFNPSRLLAGSEGTLAIIKDVTLNLVDTPLKTGLAIMQFNDFVETMEAVPLLLEKKPSAIELLDSMLLELTSEHKRFSSLLSFVRGNPAAILAVEYYGQDEAEVTCKLRDLEKYILEKDIKCDFSCSTNSSEINRVWELRKAGLGLLMSKRSDFKPVSCIEDVSVPVDNLAEYVRDLLSVFSSLDTKAGFYGHASAGCLHVRPLVNLKSHQGVSLMRELTDEAFRLAKKYSGVMSGEHGDGLQRSYLNRVLMGEEIYTAMREMKNIFDPHNILNPGKVVDSPQPEENLRYSDYKSINLNTELDWSDDNGLSGAVEMCSGQGACRKFQEGIMCPSFVATMNERDSTRARANILRAVLSGRLDRKEIFSEGFKKVFDLCIMCKACKSECPSKVDAAKMKIEYLSVYNGEKGSSMRDRIFANVHELSKYGSYLPGIANSFNSLINEFFSSKTGISSKRNLPRLSDTKFSDWFDNNTHSNHRTKKVLYFHDTWSSYYYPGIGISALKVLQTAGCEVVIEKKRQCCGRPMLSKGFISNARDNARKNIEVLTPYLDKGYAIVGTEPSCILTFRDEYPYLLPGDGAVKQLSESSYLLEEYLCKLYGENNLDIQWNKNGADVFIHGHCHQRSMIGKDSYLDILGISGCNVTDSMAGCCGMAGSFGYESEHYDISRRIGEDRLFPGVRNSEDKIIGVTGISCYQQIEHFTGRKPKHIAEILDDRIDRN